MCWLRRCSAAPCVVHPADTRRAVPHAARDGPRAGRAVGKRTRGRAPRLLVPGLRRIAGQPRRHGQPGRRGHGNRRRRSRSGLLDVGHRPRGGRERLRRIDPRATLQTPRPRLLRRRPGLLHGVRARKTMDGRAVRRADLRNVRICLQLGAEQHDLRRMGGGLRARSALDRRRAHRAHAPHHLRRHPPHRPGQRRDRPGHGPGLHPAGPGHRPVQHPPAARGARADPLRGLRLGPGLGRNGWRGAHAGHQARSVQQRGRHGFGSECRRHGPRLASGEAGG